jgi:uroporphyrin-III C-methyltransferase/precorrin-2 dehydrogenase/sirohydrochlorin ferrochelatase
MPADTPVAVVERGWTDDQRTTVGDLTGIADAVAAREVRSPAIIVVGAVAALADDPTANVLDGVALPQAALPDRCEAFG